MNNNSRATIRRICPRTLAGAALVLALAGETYLMSLHNNAAAAPAPRASGTSLTQKMPGPHSVSSLRAQAAFDDADRRIARLVASGPSGRVPLSALKSNPFEQAAPTAAGTSPITPPGIAVAQDRAAVLAALAALELQSVVVGEAHRSCVINNVTCEEGQQTEGFTVETIANGSVTVSRGIYRFDLTPHQ